MPEKSSPDEIPPADEQRWRKILLAAETIDRMACQRGAAAMKAAIAERIERELYSLSDVATPARHAYAQGWNDRATSLVRILRGDLRGETPITPSKEPDHG